MFLLLKIPYLSHILLDTLSIYENLWTVYEHINETWWSTLLGWGQN